MTTTEAATAPLQFLRQRNLQAKSDAEREAILADPGFGQHFTDHMVDLCWSEKGGWHRPRVRPYGPLSIDPAAAVLHYAQEIFEGLKAYRHADGSVWTFRAEQNALRLQRSARRLALPELPVEHFLQSIEEILTIDGAWVPDAPETSLYLRPFMWAKEAFLGVRPAKKVEYTLIASPAGAYFTGGVEPVSIWLSSTYSRAGEGGMGAAKTGGNYASSLLPQQEAYANGCSQVLFLDALEHRYIEELGGMNVFLVYGDGRLVTPATSGTILEGITRDSIIQLAKDRGLAVEERQVSLDEWREGVESGAITEVFACGTAAVVTPIAELRGAESSIVNPAVGEDSLTLSLREELTGIQYGRVEDRHGWMTRITG